ncbi:tyrosine-type recombinase/integrase [Sphingomonas immobilis]|uniref:Tyrosine-type recombinase/integrase n=1 Tax=Sphingomonas immobilis TaxID=3063997 RepID=A0ABT9A1R1_9SPHN|nr:site-specific integrase [Sphingomonas sp. CA1-15]MDO7843763.1 tyrosine-type recombinase/integrase [Sphingomonas sp. CA1-15]
MASRARNKLNVKQVEALLWLPDPKKPLDEQRAPAEPNVYSDGGGLYLRVRPSGRSWFYIGTLDGKRIELGLGSALDISLSKAREKAGKIRSMLIDGKDPRAERSRTTAVIKPAVTFGKFAMDLVADIEDGFKNPKHRQQWRNTLTTYAQPLFDTPIADVTTENILAILQPIWLSKPETASRVRGRVERVLDAAKVKGLRSGENPARGRGHLELLLPKRSKASVKHHPALPFAEIATFMAVLGKRPAIAARALEFTILTAARSGEARGMTWSEVDMEAKLWTVPASRMKASVTHEVPLSDAALAILETCRPDKFKPTDFVFPAPRGGSLSDMALSQLLKRMERDDITVHGFRSTFRDWAGEKTQFAREEIEMALAHTVASAVERAYRRGTALEKRREVMAAWADYCLPASLPSDLANHAPAS